MLKSIMLISGIIIGLGFIYGVDRLTSENPSDAAAIYVGLSDSDSSGCDASLVGGKYYVSGSKHCSQDGIVFHTFSSQNNPYLSSWSNDQGIHYGDSNCNGENHFSLNAKSGDTYWIEIVKANSNFDITMYNNEMFSEIGDSLSINMCSNPTDLKYFKISTEDGKPAANGGKIVGYIDDISLWNNISIDEFNKELPTHFAEDFSNCDTETCDEWTLQEKNMLYIDTMQDFFYFNSQVYGLNNNADIDVGNLSDEQWILRFKFHIDTLENHPAGKGVLQIEPKSERILFAIFGIIGISSVILWEYKTKNERKN